MSKNRRSQGLAWLCAAFAAVGSVAAAPASAEPTSLLGAWKIVQARTEPILDQRHAQLVLGADGQLRGHTSCNTMSAPYTLDGSRIRVGAIVTTRAACSPLRLEQEDRILTALESAVTATVRGDGLLEIRDSDGRGLLRAVRFEPAAPADALPPAPQTLGTWPVVGRQGIIKIVIVPIDAAHDRSAYDREIATICQLDQSCFINFYSNSSGAPVGMPLPDAISGEATAIFRRSVKQAGEFFRWSCRLGLPDGDCF